MVHGNNSDPVHHRQMGGVASSTGQPKHRINATWWGECSKDDRRGGFFPADNEATWCGHRNIAPSTHTHILLGIIPNQDLSSDVFVTRIG